MPRLKRDLWKAGIALAGLLLFLTLMIMIPLSASAYEGASRQALSGLVQAAPTVDVTATMTALNEEKLQHENDWWWSNGATILSSVLSALVLVGGALVGFWQWRMNRNDIRDKELKEHQEAQEKELRDREDARRKEVEAQDKELRDRAEERFKTAVTALGDKNEGTQVGGAILLRSFLNKEDEKIYGRYYTQIFDLAVAYLRPPSTPQSPEEVTPPLPLTTLRQALIVVFKEVFPLARTQNKGDTQSLDANRIQLDYAYLAGADLDGVWMPQASLQGAAMSFVSLKEAYLRGAHLVGAELVGAQLRESNITIAHLEEANFNDAHLEGAYLRGSQLKGAFFRYAHLEYAYLEGADFSGANLGGANFSNARFADAYLSWANLTGADLSGVDIEYASSLDHADLRGVRGLTKEQKDACKAKGAIVDEDTATSAPQPTVLPSPPSQSTDVQAPSAPPAQVKSPPPSTDGSSSASSQPSTEP